MLSDEFLIQNSYVGCDFLVLQMPYDKCVLELSLWAYSQEGRDDSKPDHVELLVGMKDTDENLDILRQEDINLSEYTNTTEYELIAEMSNVLENIYEEQKNKDLLKQASDYLIHLGGNRIAQINVEENELYKVFEKGFFVTDYAVGIDFLVMSAPISKSKRIELSVWVHGYETALSREKRKERNLEVLIGVRDEHNDIEILDDDDFIAGMYKSEEVALKEMLKMLKTETMKYVKNERMLK